MIKQYILEQEPVQQSYNFYLITVQNMESLSYHLQPYKDIVGTIASIVTISQFFSGAFLCKDIYRKKNCKGISATPFLGGLAVAILMLKYAYMLQDRAMIQVNIAALIFNILYIGFYAYYSTDKLEEVYKPAAPWIILIAVMLGYSQIEDADIIEYRFGFIMSVVMLVLLATPLINMKEIIDKKDATSIPFPITLMAAIVTFLWLIYGIIIDNIFMVFQNLIAFGLCLFQLFLVYLYNPEIIGIPQLIQHHAAQG